MVVSSAFPKGLKPPADRVPGERLSSLSTSDDNGGGARPSPAQLIWLRRGVEAPGYKLPLFDRSGRGIPSRMVDACLRAGWAEPWFANPFKPDWPVCRLTAKGLAAARHGRTAGRTHGDFKQRHLWQSGMTPKSGRNAGNPSS